MKPLFSQETLKRNKKRLTASVDAHVRKYNQSPNDQDRSKIIEYTVSYSVPLLQHTAQINRMPLEELYSAGVTGTVYALKNYDAEKARKSKSNFTSFAIHYIKKEIREELKKHHSNGISYPNWDSYKKHRDKLNRIDVDTEIGSEDHFADEKLLHLFIDKLPLKPDERAFVDAVREHGLEKAMELLGLKPTDVYRIKAKIKRRLTGHFKCPLDAIL